MNQAAMEYWKLYSAGKEVPESVSAWAFGDSPDEFAQSVIDGRKTATCSARILYEMENEPLPETGEHSIILNSREEPVAIIRTVDVSIVPMNEVTEEFALAEGEGSFRDWKEAHEQFFKQELGKAGIAFKDDLELVCERFELVDARNEWNAQSR